MIPYLLVAVLSLHLLTSTSALNQTAASIDGYNLRTASFITTDAPFTPEDVLLHGAPVSKWRTCIPGSNMTQCVVVPAYTDRLSFSYTFDRNYEDLYVHREPIIRLLGPKRKAAAPDVTFFDVLPTAGGEFTLRFRCATSRTSRALLFELEVSLLQETSRTVRFYKRCGAGSHPYVNATAKIGPRVHGANNFQLLPVAAIYESAQVKLDLQPPALAQAHGVPVLRSSNPEVIATLRGLTKAGTLVAGRPATLSVMFACAGRGSSIVTLRVPMPPWAPVFVQLRKRCGRSRPWHLRVSIGSDLAVISGLVRPAYRVHDAQGEIDMRRARWVPKIPANVTETAVTVGNKAGDREDVVYVERVVASIVNASVLGARVVQRKMVRFAKFRKFRLGRREERRVFVEYECRRRGSSLVVLTVQTLKYELIELGYVKYCDGPVKNKAVARLRRMKWIVLAVSLALMTLLCCVFWQRRLVRRSRAKLRYVEVNSLT